MFYAGLKSVRLELLTSIAGESNNIREVLNGSLLCYRKNIKINYDITRCDKANIHVDLSQIKIT